MLRHNPVGDRFVSLDTKVRNQSVQAITRAQIERNLAEEQRTREIGDKSERRIAQALDFLKSHKEIHDFFQTVRGGELDSRQIDFMIIPYPNHSWMIPLQGKTSQAGLEEHQRKSPVPAAIARFDLPLHLFAEELMGVMGLVVKYINKELSSGFTGYLEDRISKTLGIDQDLDSQIEKIVQLLGFNHELD